jgi:hypothetical protein
VIQETEEAGGSVFAESGCPVEAVQEPSAIVYSSVVDELSAHPIHRPPPQPAVGAWNDMLPLSNPSHSVITAEQAGMTIEQLLAATAEYDSTTGLAQTADQSSSTTGLANMMVDDDLLSFWGAAPTTFGWACFLYCFVRTVH